jgi:hypothetical protein
MTELNERIAFTDTSTPAVGARIRTYTYSDEGSVIVDLPVTPAVVVVTPGTYARHLDADQPWTVTGCTVDLAPEGATPESSRRIFVRLTGQIHPGDPTEPLPSGSAVNLNIVAIPKAESP